MEKLYYGYIYEKSGRYVKITLKGEANNIASFIARCPFSTKVQITTLTDMPILDTTGNFIMNCSDMELREEIINPLIEMQNYEIEPPAVDFIYGEAEIEENGVSKEEFVNLLEKLTGYPLVKWDSFEDDEEDEEESIMSNKNELLNIAKELIDGLEEEHNIDDIVNGLVSIMENENKTLEELREMCWNDSNEVFSKIYG